MSNRAQRRAAPGEKKMGLTAQNLIDRLRENGQKIEAAHAQQNGVSGSAPQDLSAMQTPMPDFQDLASTEIVWTWEGANFRIKANFYKPEKRYAVLVEEESTKLHAMTATDAQELSLALMAASQWETVWEHHAGKYLANDGVLPEKVVSDGITEQQVGSTEAGNQPASDSGTDVPARRNFPVHDATPGEADIKDVGEEGHGD